MTTDVLKVIDDAMTQLKLRYEFERYISKIEYPYFTGEYQESPPASENGMQEGTFVLNGFTRGSPMALEEAKEQIEDLFDRTSGYTVTMDSGNVVAVFYSESFVIPEDDEELKRIQINLTIFEWKVN